ncbi:MAG: hypothetical protein ACKVX7_20685 [Planctomycetota bacterium]
MKTITLDKIGSVTRNVRLNRDVRIGDDFPCQAGDVVVVRVLTRKSTYNTLELPSGRFSALNPGDVIAGALGHRRALSGYAGHVPATLRVGDRLQVLNLGGVLGVCDASHPDLGPPFECEVLGQALHFPFLAERIGLPANIRQGALEPREQIQVGGVPVIAVVGTCMNAGKTAAACALVQELVRSGRVVHAAKATGVSLRRDAFGMEDAGARKTLTFTDLGIVTTSRETAPGAARSLLSHLASSAAEAAPDVIVLELGDGLMGDYGVDAILESPDIRRCFSAIVLAANDPVGAWGGVERLRLDYELATTVITGPATDNIAGTEVITKRTGVPAINARAAPRALTDEVLRALGFADDGRTVRVAGGVSHDE